MESHRPTYLLVTALLLLVMVLLLVRRPSAVVWAVDYGEAFRHAPLLSGGLLVAGPEDGCLYAVQAADGRELWALRLPSPLSCPAVAAGETIAIGTRTGDLLVLSRAGTLRWRTRLDGPVAELVAAGSWLAARTDHGTIASFSLGGSPRWRLAPASSPTGLAALPSGVLVVTHEDGQAEVRGPDGQLRWRAAFGTVPLRWPVGLDPWVYLVSDQGRVFKVNSTNGRVVQSARFGAPLVAAPVASGEWCWAATSAGALAGVSSQGQVWEARLRTPATAPPVVLGTHLAVPCLDRQLRVLAAADGGWSRTIDLPADVTAGLAAGEGRLYLATWSGRLLSLALP